MSNPTLLVTAVSDFLTSTEGLESGTLARCLESYSKLSASILLAVPFDRLNHVSESIQLLAPGKGIRVLGVQRGTKGSLASAVSALALANLEEGELYIAAGDTEFLSSEPLALLHKFSKEQVELGTIVFRSEDSRFSYLNLNEDGSANYVLEKKVVGEFATTGVFYFRSIKSFLEAAEWCFVNNASFENNFYVSAALNYSLYLGGSLTWYEIPHSQFHKEFDNGLSRLDNERKKNV
jgi:hypothetical protein